jgi:hypothetical protein
LINPFLSSSAEVAPTKSSALNFSLSKTSSVISDGYRLNSKIKLSFHLGSIPPPLITELFFSFLLYFKTQYGSI